MRPLLLLVASLLHCRAGALKSGLRSVRFQRMVVRMNKDYLFLIAAICTETIGTVALKASAGFTNLWPVVIVVLGYGSSFYLLGLALNTIPVGLAYAIWSGLGIVSIAILGYFLFGERLDPAAIAGMLLIISGIFVMQVFSSSSGH